MKTVSLLASLALLVFISGCKQRLGSTSSPPQSNSTPANSQPSSPKSDRGTLPEAQEMLRKAVEHYQSAGRTQALQDFTAKKPPFHDRDLYVFCLGLNSSKLTAHGAFPQYVGMSVDVWKDADGQPLGRAIQRAAHDREEGSIEYRMVNPVSGQVEQKVSFYKKLGEDVCGVGAYNPH